MAYEVAAAIAGSALLSYLGGQQQAGATKDAARRAAEAAAFRPFDVQGGLGSATFDQGQINLQLDPRLEALQGQLFGQAQETFAGLGDPAQIAQEQFQRGMGLLAPVQARERSSLENRLFAQGRLGGTGGQQQFGGLLEAQGNVQSQLASRSLQEGLFTRGQQINQGQQLFQGGIGLQQPSLTAATLGMNAGGRQSAAGAATAPLLFQAGQANPGATAMMGFGNTLAQNAQLFAPSPYQNVPGYGRQVSGDAFLPGNPYGY